MDNSISDLLTLSHLRVTPILRKSPKTLTINWIPPAIGWMKVYIDVAVVKEKGGNVGVFYNSGWFVFGFFTIPFTGLQAFEAELFTPIYVVELVARYQLDSLWLESDSTYVV